MYLCIYVCMYICTAGTVAPLSSLGLLALGYVCVCACVHVRMYVCVYACMQVCLCGHVTSPYNNYNRISAPVSGCQKAPRSYMFNMRNEETNTAFIHS